MLLGSSVRAVVINPVSGGGNFICGENKAWQGECTAGGEAAHGPADSKRESSHGQLAARGWGQDKHREPLRKGRMENPVCLCK